MIALLGHCSAREQMIFQRLSRECGDEVRFYLIGEHPVVSGDPRTVKVRPDDPKANARLIREDGVSLVLITDTLLLQTDALDACTAEGIAALGPSRHAALIEARKSLTKDIATAAGVPTPQGWLVKTAEEAKALLRRNWSEDHKYVVKTDALIADAIHRAMVPEDLEEGEQDVDEELEALLIAHEDAGLVIERRVTGFETSVHVLWDGSSYVLMPPVRDYKRVGDGDTGPNTFGAASIACGHGFGPELERALRERIIEPALSAIADAGYGYRGFVYFGVMLLEDGPTLLEINVRPGNPEFIALLGLLDGGFCDLVRHAAAGTLHRAGVSWHRKYCGTVFALGAGYPHTMTPAPVPIVGLEEAVAAGDTLVEDVARGADGRLQVAGGRVAAPFALGDTIEAARERVAKRLADISFEGKHFRSDLGYAIHPKLFAAPAAS
ncbi:MAG: phosphoribosylglycinamide synthetase C domain-containing protein [Devosia sp.]